MINHTDYATVSHSQLCIKCARLVVVNFRDKLIKSFPVDAVKERIGLIAAFLTMNIEPVPLAGFGSCCVILMARYCFKRYR